MFIEGSKSSKNADVDEKHRLIVASTVKSNDNFINDDTGKVWSLPFLDIDPVGADDVFFYLTNTGTKVIKITDIRISSTVIGIVSVKKVSGTPTYSGGGAIAITPVSRRTDKSPVLQATANTGTDITALTDEGTWFFLPCDTAGKEQHLRTTSNIMLAPGGGLALEWDQATGILTGVVSVVENGE